MHSVSWFSPAMAALRLSAVQPCTAGNSASNVSASKSKFSFFFKPWIIFQRELAWDLSCSAVSRNTADICSYPSTLAVLAYQV
ncbi:hypothetical protein DSECCO2_495280 [anaerobic digester metagenome]